MRRTVLLTGVLLSVVALGSDSPKHYDDRMEDAGIEGTWQIVAINDAGKVREPGSRCIQTFWGGRWTYSQAGRASSAGAYTKDNRHAPALFDELFGEPVRARKYIYQIEGDTLRTAFWTGDYGERPASFDEPRLYIVTWKRVR